MLWRVLHDLLCFTWSDFFLHGLIFLHGLTYIFLQAISTTGDAYTSNICSTVHQLIFTTASSTLKYLAGEQFVYMSTCSSTPKSCGTSDVKSSNLPKTSPNVQYSVSDASAQSGTLVKDSTAACGSGAGGDDGDGNEDKFPKNIKSHADDANFPLSKKLRKLKSTQDQILRLQMELQATLCMGDDDYDDDDTDESKATSQAINEQVRLLPVPVLPDSRVHDV